METFCNKIDSNTEPSLVFNTIKKINGTSKKKPTQAPLVKGGKTASSCREKENMMIKHYASVSKSTFHASSGGRGKH